MLAAILLTMAVADAPDPAAVAKGQALFTANHCTICHSVAGKGNPKGPLDTVGDKHSPEEFRKWLTEPVEMAKKANATRKPPMISFAKLPAADLDALVAYLGSLKKK
jgi:mono/diheme cytochrome c family protein